MPQFYYAEDLINMLNISRTKAYDIIKDLNNELEAKGYMTLSGRIPVKYYNERFYC